MRGSREIKQELEPLELKTPYSIVCDKRVKELVATIQKENAEKISLLKKKLETVESSRTQTKSTRWPENTPQHILDFCKEYWRGTVESAYYRIHCWNDKAVWTSYPSGGYSVVGGYVKTQATFFLVTLKEKDEYNRAQKLKTLEGRVSMKFMQTELEKL